MRICKPISLLVIAAQFVSAGQFRYGFAGARSDSAKLRVPKPPVISIGKKQIAVEVLSTSGAPVGGLTAGTLNGVAPPTPWQRQNQQIQQGGGGYGNNQAPGGGSSANQQGGGYGGGYTADPNYGTGQPQARILSEIAAPDLGAIRIAAEQVLATDFTIVQQAPERIVRLHVAGFDPVRTQQSVIQQTVQDQAGEQVQVPVDVWEGLGRLSLRVEIVDPATSRVLDGFAPNAEFKQRGAIAVAGQARVDPATLPLAESIWRGLVREATNPLKERYTTTIESVEFNLATDDELRPGNDLAKNNYWKEALEKWQTATLKKPENEGDKVFNLGAAHEAMAYETMLAKGAVAARPLFEKALELYAEAARLDPKEKNISSATDRLKKTAVYLNRGIQQHNASVAEMQTEQQAQQQLAAQRAAEEQAQAAAGKARLEAEEAKRRQFSAPRADTIAEANFRKLVRVRLRALNAAATPEDQVKLQFMGQQTYKLQPDEAERVVYQESGRWTELLPKIAQYKETYSALFADRRIGPDEREVLKQLAETLTLAADEAAAIEAQYQ